MDEWKRKCPKPDLFSMRSSKSNDQDLYRPPARRNGGGTADESTPTKNDRQGTSRELHPNCCEEVDDVTGNSPIKSESSSVNSFSSNSSRRRTNAPSVSSSLSLDLQGKCNIGPQQLNNSRKIMKTTRLVGGNWRTESSFGYGDNAAQDSSGNNSPRFDTLFEELHLANTPYIDSHCHTDFIYTQLSKTRDFKEDEGIEAWVDRYPDGFPKAFAGCIVNFIKPDLFVDCGNKEFDFEWILKEIRSDLYIGTTWGCHPHHAEIWGQMDAFWATLDHILSRGSKYKVLAVGECGIDLNRCESGLEVQKTVFDKHIQMAYKYNLPLVIHCRSGHKGNAEDICLEILKANMENRHPLKIHRHCYTENWPTAQRWLKQCSEVLFGYTPAIFTFKEAQLEAVRRIPLDRILLETDAPYFKPRCFDGVAPPKVSLPGMAIATASRIADIKNCSLEEVLRATYNNTRRVYQIPVY